MAGGNLATLNVKLTADASTYNATFRAATDSLSKFSKSIEDQFKDLGGTIAAAFTIDSIFEFTKNALESAASLQKLSQAAGVSVESISSLQIAMAGSGITTEELATSFKKLNESASEAAGDSTSKAAQAYKLLGVNVLDANGHIKDATTLLSEVADAYSKTADGANKVAIGAAIGGKNFQELIPTLDQGSAALKAQQQAAIDAGAALSGPAAAAAEEAEKAFAQLTATAGGQLKVAIVTGLTPALEGLSKALAGDVAQGQAVSSFGTGISTVFKGVATVVLELAGGFEELGNIIGATAAAAVAAAHLNFGQVKDIFKDLVAQNQAVIARYDKAQAALWNDAADAQIAAAKRGAGGAADAQAEGAAKKPDPGNLALLTKGAEGVKSLNEFAAGIKNQAAAFDLGAEAATRLKLQTGALGEAMKVANDAQKAIAGASPEAAKAYQDIATAAHNAAAAAISAAHALQTKTDTKAADDVIESLVKETDLFDQSEIAAFRYSLTTGKLGEALDRLAKSGNNLRPALEAAKLTNLGEKDAKAIADINIQLDQMAGNLAKAAQAQFDLQNKGLRDNIKAVGGPDEDANLAKVNALEKAKVAQQQFNELAQKASDIQANYASVVADVSLAEGGSSDHTLANQAKLEAAQAVELQQLHDIYDAKQAIAQANPGLVELSRDTQAFGNSIKELQANAHTLTKQINDDFKSAFADNLLDAETGTKSLSQAFHSMVLSIQKDLLQIANKDIAEQIFGSGTGSGTSGLAGLLAGLLGGGPSNGSPAFGSDINSAVNATGGIQSDAQLIQGLDLFADGGTIKRGGMGIVGDAGPEIAVSGAKDLQIIPMNQVGGGGGVSVTNNFMTPVQNGTISRQTQMQQASNAAQAVGFAARRNGRR